MIIILLPAQLREGQSATVASPSALTKTYNNSRGILLPQGCEASRVLTCHPSWEDDRDLIAIRLSPGNENVGRSTNVNLENIGTYLSR